MELHALAAAPADGRVNWRKTIISLGRLLSAACLLLPGGAAFSLPLGGQTVAGNASVAVVPSNTLAITQSSQRAIIDWQSFGIAPGESVVFRQPNAGAVTLNRILGGQPSEIQGRINANGQVFLVNPSGVLFGPTASVDVGGLAATTLAISNQDFLAGRMRFSGLDDSAGIRNSGRLTANAYVALIAPVVANDGTIAAGNVALAAGKQVSLDFAGDDLLKINVDQAALNASIDNSGAIVADGGRVLLTARAAGELVGTVINQSGIVEAKSLSNRNGQIVLDGGTSGSVNVAGALDVSGKASGGSIGVFGWNIGFQSASLDASGQSAGGTVLVGGDSRGTPAVAAGNPVANARTLSIDAASRIKADARAQGDGGKVMVWSEGTTRFDGSISARGGPQGGDGGLVETSGARLKVGDRARVDTLAPLGKTGTWLLDPDGFTIGSDITGAALTNNLLTADVTVASTNGSGADGNVNVNDTVGWASHALTLTATNDININAVMTATGSASLNLNPGAGHAALVGFNPGAATGFKGRVDFSGTGALQINGTSYTVVSDLTGLQAMSSNLAGNYALGANIDASATNAWNGGSGFMPVGDVTTNFTGRFDGLGHTISGLVIDQPTTDNIGLFGVTSAAIIRNVGLVGGSVSGGTSVGALIGSSNYYTSILQSYATADVIGSANVGGLVGYGHEVIVSNAYAAGNVSAAGNNGTAVGGLLGHDEGYSSIVRSYASGNVNGGTSSSSDLTGGLIGYLKVYTTLTDVYATGTVTGYSNVGGLVGNVWENDISNAYATGCVVGTSSVGGLVGGKYSGAITNSFWDTQTSGQATSAGGTGKTSAEMMQYSTYSNWNSATPNTIAQTGGSGAVWRIYAGHTYPLLTSFLTPLTLGDAPDVSVVYNGAAQSGASTAKGVVLGSAATGTNSGFYNGYYSSQQGYDITGGNLTITPKPLTMSGLSVPASKVYDGTTTAVVTGTGALATAEAAGAGSTADGIPYDVDTVNITGTAAGTYNVKDVGATSVIFSGLSLAGAQAGNYSLNVQSPAAAAITPKPLTLAATAASKTYDGNDSATVTGYGLAGFVGTETVNGTSTAATFSDKNAANGKTVTITGINLNDGSNGGLASNYSVAASTTATADITAKQVTLTAPAVSKTYDGGLSYTTSGADLTVLSAGLIGGDMVTAASIAYSDKNAGTGNKTVSLNSATVSDGNGGNNYTVSLAGNSGSTITPASLALNAVTDTKVYDGGTNSAGTVATVGLQGGDSVGSLSQRYASKNVLGANGSTLRVDGGYTVNDGNGGANYSVTTNTAAGTITPAPLSASLTAADKVYDATTSATITGRSLAGVIGGDAVSLTGGTASFDTKDVGTGKLVTATGLTLAGLDAGNYTASSTATTRADITPASLTISLTAGITAADKVYDGTTATTITDRSLLGVIGGDDVSLTGGTASFDNKNVGTAKTVTVIDLALSGAAAGNYTAKSTATTTANITPAPLTVSVTAADKVYDATTSATITGRSLAGVIGGDDVSLTGGTASFDNKNVGIGKTVTATGLMLAGPDAGNYTANIMATTMATITPARLIYLADSASRAYGQVNPAFTGKVTGFLQGETQADATTGSLTFSSTAVPTSPEGRYEIDGGGLSAANYSFSQAPENSAALRVFAAAEPPVLSPVVPVAILPPLLSQEEAPIQTSQADRSRDAPVPCKSALSKNVLGSYSLAWNCGAPKR